MAGWGPARKDADKKARRNKDQSALRVVHDVVPDPQPKLPPLMICWVDEFGRSRSKRIAWPAQTRTWWKMWADSKLSDDFTATDWSELLDTARLHAAYWRGDLKVAGELRLRVAKFGATPEDRLRLRIQFAMAKHAETSPPAPQQGSAGGVTPQGDAGEVEVPRGPRRLVG